MTQNKKLFLWLWSSLVILVVLAIVLFVARRTDLANEVNVKLAAIRAAGLPTNGRELNAYYPAVPDNQNAALVMTQAFALMRTFSDGRSNEIASFIIQPRGQRLTAKQKKIFSDYVAMNSDALAKMREAVKLPESRYPVDYTPGPNTPLLHLRKLHNLAEMVRCESLLASESGDTTNAAVAIENLLGMARTLDEEPDLIAQLVRISFVAMAENSLEHCLNVTNLSESELAGLASAFSSADKTNLMAKALAGELAINTPVFIQANRNANGARELVKGAKDAGEVFATPTLDTRLIRDPRFYQVIGFWDRDLLYYLNVMETNIALASFAPPQNLVAANNLKKAENEAEQNHCYLSKLFIEALSNALTNDAEHFAYLRTSTAAIAIERFQLLRGKLPEKLNELVPQFLPAVPIDPFNGKPLRFRHLAKGYVIYSIGTDGRDDGGKEKPADWKFGDKTNFDLTFTVER